jgi:hypothetical protein
MSTSTNQPAAPKKRGADTVELEFMDHRYPTRVNQKDRVGRPDIDSFGAVMTREDRTKGFFVAFDYSGDALREIDAFLRKSGKVIVALTVHEIPDEQLAKKPARVPTHRITETRHCATCPMPACTTVKVLEP